MWHPFAKKLVPQVAHHASLLPHCIAILVCWALPALYTLYDRDRGSAIFAAVEALTCAVGNGLLTALPLYMASQDFSSYATDAAVQALIWVLFMAMYFPLEGHMNAALTAGAWACGQVSLAIGTVFVSAQCLGTALGVEIARLAVRPELHQHVGYPAPPYVEEAGAFWFALSFEVGCSVLMVLVQLGLFSSIDKRYVVASTLVVVLTRYTGAAMDPLGPTSGAIFGRDASPHLLSIYWVGGLVGGAIAGWIWRHVLGREGALDE